MPKNVGHAHLVVGIGLLLGIHKLPRRRRKGYNTCWFLWQLIDLIVRPPHFSECQGDVWDNIRKHFFSSFRPVSNLTRTRSLSKARDVSEGIEMVLAFQIGSYLSIGSIVLRGTTPQLDSSISSFEEERALGLHPKHALCSDRSLSSLIAPFAS